MKNNFRNLFTLIAAGLVFFSFSHNQITCTLKGTISGRNSDTIILIKATEDVRFAQIMIPIRDSAFEYKLVIPETEAYQLVFKDESDRGSWRPIYFFPENGTVKLKLYPFNDFGRNQIEGGQLNKKFIDYTKSFENTFKPRYQPLSDSISVLMMKKQYYSAELDSLIKMMQMTRDQESLSKIRAKMDNLRNQGKDLSPKGDAVRKQNMALKQEANKWRYNYIKENLDLVSYYFLVEDLKSIKFNLVDIEDIKNSFPEFAKTYPSHPYTALMKILLETQDVIKVGGKFIDFSLPDLNGNIYKLSDLIKNKVALIDLWASWCGPCIANSRSMVPVYEEFSKTGFTICAVAAEIKNTDQLKTRLEKEKFPWINLIDLDHKNHIWDKYGISNAGGGTFLVDKDGKILAINPTPEQVKTILTEKLK